MPGLHVPSEISLEPPSVSAKVEHCGLALEGRQLLGLFAEMDSRRLALEDCKVILPWGM